MRIVIDTNILVAAFLNPNGYTAVFMDKVLGNHYEIVVTESILAEYEDVLSRPQFGFPKETVSFLMKWFRQNAYLVEVDENDYPCNEMPDPKDAPFYVAARATKSRLVTGNIKHYPIEEMRTMLWELM